MLLDPLRPRAGRASRVGEPVQFLMVVVVGRPQRFVRVGLGVRIGEDAAHEPPHLGELHRDLGVVGDERRRLPRIEDERVLDRQAGPAADRPGRA